MIAVVRSRSDVSSDDLALQNLLMKRHERDLEEESGTAVRDEILDRSESRT